MNTQSTIILAAGDTFRSKFFVGLVKVIEVVPTENRLHVRIDPQEKNRQVWDEKDWNLDVTLRALQFGEYYELMQREVFDVVFWDEIKAKYPNGYKIFLEWIVVYKKRVKWNDLFNGRGMMPGGKNAIVPYMQDLPIAFQIGIFMEFVMEREDLVVWEIEDMLTHDWRENFMGYFEVLEKESAKINK